MTPADRRTAGPVVEPARGVAWFGIASARAEALYPADEGLEGDVDVAILDTRPDRRRTLVLVSHDPATDLRPSVACMLD